MLLTKILVVGERLRPPVDKAAYEALCHENQSLGDVPPSSGQL